MTNQSEPAVLDVCPVVGVGWDAAGWAVGGQPNRNQAIAIARWMPGTRHLDWTTPGCGVSKAFCLAEAGGLEPEVLVAQVHPASWGLISDPLVRVVVAIDAPLGFPEAFVDFVRCPWAFELPPSHAENRLAFRETERHILTRPGVKPFSPSLDSVTHVTTVALSSVARWRDAGYRLMPQDGPADKEPLREVIEVYPALAKVPRRRARKGEPKAPRAAALPEVASLLRDDLSPEDDHRYDAAVCTVMAILYAAAGSFPGFPAPEGPPEGCAAALTEGWIYYALPSLDAGRDSGAS